MARIQKSKLPEIHIDIDSHNENPIKKWPKTGALDAIFTVKKMGMDSYGNHAVWISNRGARAVKVQTNQNLPVTHRDKSLTPGAYDELLDYAHAHLLYGRNPSPRKGTARPRRKSQITGKAPSKRLVKRRLANSEPGYFPNPSAVEHVLGKAKYPFAVVQKHGDDVTMVGLFPSQAFAAGVVGVMNKHAASGVTFYVMKA